MAYPMRSLALREDDIGEKPNIPPERGPEIVDLEPADSGIDDGLLPKKPEERPRTPPRPFPTYPDTDEEGFIPVSNLNNIL